MKHETRITDAAEAAIAAASLIVTDDAPHLHDPVVAPIYQTSLFTFKNYAAMRDAFAGQGQGYIYSRVGNPTVHDFERRIAALEQAEAARAFSSGMAAISSTVLSIVQAGDRIVAVRHCYGDAYRFFEKLLPRFDVTVDYVDGSDAEAVEAALPGAKLLYLESPSSMVFELQDIARLANAARAQGITIVMDNSWATPIFQKPVTHGVDLVLHSASKYIGGHSDTVAGVVAGARRSSPGSTSLPIRSSAPSSLRSRHSCSSGACALCRSASSATWRAHLSSPNACAGTPMSPKSIIRSIPIIRAARRCRASLASSRSRSTKRSTFHASPTF